MYSQGFFDKLWCNVLPPPTFKQLTPCIALPYHPYSITPNISFYPKYYIFLAHHFPSRPLLSCYPLPLSHPYTELISEKWLVKQITWQLSNLLWPFIYTPISPLMCGNYIILVIASSYLYRFSVYNYLTNCVRSSIVCTLIHNDADAVECSKLRVEQRAQRVVSLAV